MYGDIQRGGIAFADYNGIDYNPCTEVENITAGEIVDDLNSRQGNEKCHSDSVKKYGVKYTMAGWSLMFAVFAGHEIDRSMMMKDFVNHKHCLQAWRVFPKK